MHTGTAAICSDSLYVDFGRLDAWNLDARTLDAWSCENWTLGLLALGPKKLKLHFTVKGAVADYDNFNSGF